MLVNLVFHIPKFNSGIIRIKIFDGFSSFSESSVIIFAQVIDELDEALMQMGGSEQQHEVYGTGVRDDGRRVDDAVQQDADLHMVPSFSGFPNKYPYSLSLILFFARKPKNFWYIMEDLQEYMG